MARVVYLLRNGDLYKIGHTEDMEKIKKKLKPDEIIKTIETTEPFSIEARLIARFKSCRIPETEYFRLDEQQLQDCINQMSTDPAKPLSLKEEVSIGFKGALVLGISGTLLSILFHSGLARGLAIGFGLSSLPMWVLFLTGSFGGYDAEDVPTFSTWSNRFKGLLFALSFSSIAYTLESLHRLI
ncbi:GIY-YIG nuclease family protein [Prochlorococcus sp. MIT 1341]|uniref:GIY-YIG nuclease family protein n=1 Tax=Prochlorococcus sp. MIT 1341 TaxID=3096221 RepID=UPI002A74CF07|nr:GIY-YIG nuclease family protein [Prochlorococcus sp. MIT 1341]